MNKEVVGTFVEFYYRSLNERNFVLLKPHLKGSSTFVRDTSEWNGTNHIISCLQSNAVTYKPVKLNVLVNGDRRANVLVSGTLVPTDHTITAPIPYSEYLLLSYSNTKEYWIHTSMLHVIV